MGKRNLMERAALLGVVLSLVAAGVCHRACGDPVEESRVLDGCGGWSTNGVHAGVIAACQPMPVGRNANESFLNQSGFLATFLMHPGGDHDRDGMADEDDPDDDNDGLSDFEELAGTAFSPPTRTDPMAADSDGDGSNDGDESDAGTHPGNIHNAFRITDVRVRGSNVVVTWHSRDGYTYDLLCADTVDALGTNAQTVATLTAAGGEGDWQETESPGTNTTGAARTYYRVKVDSP